MFRILITFCVAIWAQNAQALCVGTSFMDRLTPAERLEISDAVTDIPFPSGLFWQANRGEKTIYVIGTMHLYDPRLEPIKTRVAPFVQSSEILLVEATDEDEQLVQETMANNPDMIFITEGPTLIDRLDDETWQALKTAAAARNIPGFMAGKMQPWYLSLTLSIPPCLVSELASGQPGLDAMLIEIAQSKSIPVQAVESALETIGLLNSGTFDEQLEALSLSIAAPELQSEMFVAMLNSYFAENVSEIWEASRIAARYVDGIDESQADALLKQMEDTLLIGRNRAWIPVIETATQSHDILTLAVGASHLPGRDGVLALLAGKGWTIVAMP